MAKWLAGIAATVIAGVLIFWLTEGRPRPSPSTRKVFRQPMFGGYRLDLCLDGASLCGKPAADAWCKEKGFNEATNHKEDPDIGGHSPTKVFRNGGICSKDSCDGFEIIECG